MWIYWNTFEVSNVSFFLDLSINYNIFFWHDLWNDAWIGWMIFCYENILFEMLWWSMIEHIDFMMHYIDWFRYYMIIYFLIEIRIWNMIYEKFWYKNNINWQPDYVKDPANEGIYVSNWFILRVYIVSDMSPERSATNRQRDQRFRRTLLPDNSQLTARRYAMLWSCHRKNMVIAHGWRKEFKNERNWNLKRNSNFEKK